MLHSLLLALWSPALLIPTAPVRSAVSPPLPARCSLPRVAPSWIHMAEEAEADPDETRDPEAEVAAAPEVEVVAADDPKAAADEEKKALRDQISALEKTLVDARGTLLAEQDSVKDAGEGGYLLLAANFERFRQKARTEISSQEAVGRNKAAGSLMTFVDEFEALQAEAAGVSEPEAKIHSFYGGIHKQLLTMLESWQLAAVEPQAGDVADFSKHVTVERKESEQVAGTVLETRKKGYAMGGLTVRSAEVIVSSGPPKAEDEEQVEAEASEAEASEAEAPDAEAPPSE